MLMAACGAPATEQTSDADRQKAADRTGGNVQTNEPINQRFGSLDEYLVFLERTQGPVDGPWYREIRPGVYQLQTGNFRGDTEQQRLFTREELMTKFGFSR